MTRRLLPHIISWIALLSSHQSYATSNTTTTFQKYCQGTSTPCEFNHECTSQPAVCRHPYEWTAVEEPDHSKKLKVFIMMGQSNMIGYGQVHPVQTQGTLLNEISNGNYPHLITGFNGTHATWRERRDVRIVHRRYTSSEQGNTHLSVDWIDDSYVGLEVQFGNIVGHVFDNPILIIKVGVGGKSMGYDFLPPGSARYTSGGKSYPGYGQCPQVSNGNAMKATEDDCGSCRGNSGPTCPVFWDSIETCKSSCGSGSHAGQQYDNDARNAKAILSDIQSYYPDYQDQGFEIAGFVFWQGYNDQFHDGHPARYKVNMQNYINALINEYSEYEGTKKFVHATVAFGGNEPHSDTNKDGYKSAEDIIYQAQRKVNGEDIPSFKDIVKVVDARPFWRPGEESPVANRRHHYHQNANVYMDVGNALGWAMVDLLLDTDEFASIQGTYQPSAPPTKTPTISPSFRPTSTPSTRPTPSPTKVKTSSPTSEPSSSPVNYKEEEKEQISTIFTQAMTTSSAYSLTSKAYLYSSVSLLLYMMYY